MKTVKKIAPFCNNWICKVSLFFDHDQTCTLLMMAENDTFPSVFAGESQVGNPIGSALVSYKDDRTEYSAAFTCTDCSCRKT